MYSNFYYVDFSGMLSKSKGQILRVAASFHILFQLPNGVHDVDDADHTLNGECDDNAIIADSAIIAAIAFVTLCCQQTAYMAGRGNIKEELKIIKASMFFYYTDEL